MKKHNLQPSFACVVKMTHMEENASDGSHKFFSFAATMAVEREGRLLDLFSILAFAAMDGRNQDATL